jgi:cytochrome c-550 PedF
VTPSLKSNLYLLCKEGVGLSLIGVLKGELMKNRIYITMIVTITLCLTSQVQAHGNVTPQAVDVTSLPPLGTEWLEQNPYSGNPAAVAVGASAYNQNCARCHGLEGISGGIAPDLRELEAGLEGDEWYVYRVREGATRNNVPYMPRMADFLSQESLWAIRAWLETVAVN